MTSLGLNADEVVAKFQQGGDSAKEAMQQISDALKNCDDETVQYTAGVGIMGTMYEDMGLDACTALLLSLIHIWAELEQRPQYYGILQGQQAAQEKSRKKRTSTVLWLTEKHLCSMCAEERQFRQSTARMQ